ncbi:MAG: hypothetical protein N3E38_01450 [Candidatus Aenigmarchaeota archaeon]|nr:hypothetical protein [Candidatus Aenigmarchaeota archaeon]
MLESKIPLNIGEMSFYIENIKKFKLKLKSPIVTVSLTPIIVRIPEKNYKKYNITDGNKRYVFWRPKYNISAFINQIEDNMFKKYELFYQRKLDRFNIIEGFELFDTKCNHILINGKEHNLIYIFYIKLFRR